eukprot:CAMPEP_0118697376 /NCGR_PEP_ID=MMETSP0800-20121206/14471_1 /TAXON_ID=210618 ORGANISM="Striatella unipunctata, Strain CCMP2910" /NCGR_SAMPLE_ID=MMETSP0800 /ASSEMBLY_ACC=CAM_ASM_000638 /LENGTH=301 /DNA_ID=CAMNT_0006596799 /DNA_START=158 /DNA_END=1063 /DNA_ORIENTATION=+
MIKVAVASLSGLMRKLSDTTPPGLILSIASATLVEGKYLTSYLNEFFGTCLMILCTFSAGKWVGSSSLPVAWVSHFFGVIAADYFGGGPHVNPAVSVSMWALGKINYTECYIRIAAQMGGGLVSFPIYKLVSDSLGWTPFGGPEFEADDEYGVEAFMSEFWGVLLLLIFIYLVNWEMHFGTYHYWIKQPMTALWIRYLIEVFPTAGPAINPMLATSWAVFGVGQEFEFPNDPLHYIVYWIAPFAAAVLASVLYVIYAGGTIFGQPLPFGPLKEEQAPPAAAVAAEPKKKEEPKKEEPKKDK